jgi:AcrR family transcriptional regulator
MGRPPLDEVAGGERRAQILTTASQLFARRGYVSVSIGDIADAVGVTKAALYHHFPSKDELFTAVVCTALEAIAAAIRRVVDLPSPLPDKIALLTEIAILEVHSDADLDSMMRDVAEHLSAEQRARVRASHRALEESYEALMRLGIAQGALKDHDPKLLAHAYAHLLAAFAGRVGMEAGFQGRRAVVDTVVDLFLNGAGT